MGCCGSKTNFPAEDSSNYCNNRSRDELSFSYQVVPIQQTPHAPKPKTKQPHPPPQPQPQPPNSSPSKLSPRRPRVVHRPDIIIGKPLKDLVSIQHTPNSPTIKQSPPQPQQPKPSPPKSLPPDSKIVQRPDTILEKPLEDLRQYYSLGNKLGRGQFGIAYVCTEISTGHVYACKSVLKRKLVTMGDKDDVNREVQIMQHLSGNQNIVEFKGAFEDRQSVHLVMELCTGGELFDTISAQCHYSERDAAKICREIVNVVHICHFMGVMHRDLKPENFLMSSKDDNAMLKLIDFGLSVFIEDGEYLIVP